MNRPIKVAILGTGNIGTDLCARLLKDERFKVVALVGRREDSPGLKMFQGKVPFLLHSGISDLISIIQEFEGFFDATSAYDHLNHWSELKKFSKWAIDLTPSQVGTPLVPELIGFNAMFKLDPNLVANYSMVTCGGQSSAPLVQAMAKHSKGITEVEVSSSIASKSAGPATRKNIDQYVNSTENLVKMISNVDNVKAILVLNPAEPPVMMRTTVQMKVETCNLANIKIELNQFIKKISAYVPGYSLVVEPHLVGNDVLSSTVKVRGAGFVLPEYAGNLDIINAAAVQTAFLHSNQNLREL